MATTLLLVPGFQTLVIDLAILWVLLVESLQKRGKV